MRFISFCSFFLAALFLMGNAPAQPLINGDLEAGNGQDAPDGWDFGVSNQCKAAMAIDTEVKSSGARAVRLSSESEYAPNVYGGLRQVLTPLEPSTTYRVTFDAKGEDVGVVWFGGGPGWEQRDFMPEDTFDWMPFTFTFSSGEFTQFEFRINVDSPTKALWVDNVRLEKVGPEILPDPAVAGQEALNIIAEQEPRLEALKAVLEKTRGEGIPVYYPESDLTIAGLFCQFGRDDAANGRGLRAKEVADEVKGLLDRAEAEMRNGVDVPVPDTTAATLRDGAFWAPFRVGTATEERPVFFTGYGHFGDVVDALPIFPKIGINVIQIEIGPSRIMNSDGTINTDEIKNWVIAALDKAQQNNAAVCLLVSPHYFPQWAFEKCPDIEVASGFFKNSLDAPIARQVYSDFLHALIPMIKDHPALHSICLSNEPVSIASWRDPYRLPIYQAYLKKLYGAIEPLNAHYGTAYKDFSEIPPVELNFEGNLPAIYDAARCNQACFAEFHSWMAGVIHEMAPDLPCHAKVMCLPNMRGTLFWGTDPWDFATISQINGNDCYFLPNSSRPWASSWQSQNMYYDLQRSMKCAPIFNTENHIIPDREKKHVTPEHIYAAIWQGAIHGQGASTTWAWARTYDPKSDFEGLILHRAACTAAMSRCALDLNRLSREVNALQSQKPRVALLYSHAATLYDPRHVDWRSDVYAALNFTGVPIGFITDEQAAAGKTEGYNLIILAGAKAISRACAEGLRTFAANGGRLLAYDAHNAEIDEYGQPLESPLPFSATLERKRGITLRGLLEPELAAAGITPDVALASPEGPAPYGVEWRTATQNGITLVNIINLLQKPATIRLPEGAWRDAISGKALEGDITLAPNTPVLAQKG